MRTITYWFSLLMIFMIPWATILVLPGLGTSSRFIGLIVAAFWLITVLITSKVRKIGPFHVFIFLFFLWNALSVLWSTDPEAALTRTITYLQLAILSLIIWDLYTTPAAIKAGLQAYVLGLAIPIVATVASFIASAQTEFALYGRYSSSGSNTNTTAILLAMGIPFAWYLAATAGDSKADRVLRFVNYAFIPLITFAMILTGTRFAIIMALPAFIFGLSTLTRVKLGYRILIFIVLAISFFVLVPQIPQASLQRLGTIDDEIQGGDLNDRTELWGLGLDLWLENPIIGIGTAGYEKAVEPIYGRTRALHNSFLAVLTELGIIGLALFGIILVMAVSQAWRLPNRLDTWFWLTVLVSWAMGSLALTWVYSKPTWIILALLATSASLSHQPDRIRSHIKPSNRYTATVPRPPT